MLRPTKYTNLKSAPVSVGAAILSVIQNQGRASFSDVEQAVHRWCGDISSSRIQEVLILLYSVGALDYADDLDALIPGNGKDAPA